MFTRVALFLATNLAVLVLAGIVMSLLGVNPNQLGGLLVFAAIFGFGGSLISLLTSKWMAKRATGAQVIEQPRNDAERWLVATVQRQAQAAGIGMPEVAVYDAPEINAFATGANRNNALVAVSTGLLRSMNQDEAEAVLGHEVAHVANGDMVTMALLQGVLNTFVIVLARVVAWSTETVHHATHHARQHDDEGVQHALQQGHGHHVAISDVRHPRGRARPRPRPGSWNAAGRSTPPPGRCCG